MAALYEMTGDIIDLYHMAEEDDDFQQFKQEFKDTMEGLEGEFDDKAAQIGRFIRSLDADAKSLKEESDHLIRKQKAIENRSKWMREYLFNNMQAIGKTQSGDAVTTIRIQKNGGKIPLILDSDVENIPPEYQKITYSADNDKIREALDEGKQLPFAHFGERGESLRIK